MYQTNIDKRSLRSALLLGAASVAAISLSVPASAQDQAAETVVVTGTRIPQQGLYTSSPVTAVGQQELKLEGTVDVETLLDSLPSVFASQNSTSNNGSSGTSTVDLRGLGAERTLVLVDGTRLMPGDPILPAADVNTIPAAMVDHIEVLTGGASAVYGSDAIAGVVNFIMRKDFEGVELDGQYTVDQHDNSNSYAQGLINAAGFTNPFTGAPLSSPSGNVFDGQSTDATLVMGTNTADGKGNITAYVGYRNAEPILEASRDFSYCTLADKPGDTARQCAGSANYSLFISIDDAFNGITPTFFGRGNGHAGSGQFVPFVPGQANEYFNYGALNYLQRNDTRYNGGFFAHYQVRNSLEFYSNFMFTDDRSTAQLAPSAVFAGDGPVLGAYNDVNCTNPYLTAQENQVACGGINPGLPGGDMLVTSGAIEAALGHPYWDGGGNFVPGQATMEIGRRDLEGGNRTYTTEHEAFRMQIGLKGDLGDGWAYDVYGQEGYTSFDEHDGGQFSKANVENALNVDPITGQCTSGAVGCVGLDIFNGFGGVSQGALGYVEVPSLTQGFTQEQIVSGNITGDLGAWGGKSPWAKNPIAISLGAEWRGESLGLTPDEEGVSGDLEGGSATKPESGGFNVTEGFTEVQVPIVQDMPYFEDLSFNGGYRYSSYNTAAGSDSTYKYGLEWQPIDDFRLRGSFERAVRAPNVLELFSTDTVGLFSGQDPCGAIGISKASNPAQQAANCESAPGRANVPVADVGSGLLNCISSQCSELGGGNTLLKPEVSRTHTAGIVLTPTFFDGFTATVDYFDIQVDDAISPIPETTVLAQCYNSGVATPQSQAQFCPLVQRNVGTHTINNNAGYVVATEVNTGSLGTKGWDFEANYNVDLANWGAANSGSLSFNLIGTLLDNLTTEPVKGQGFYDCTGLYGLTCGTPNPAWRHKFRVTWTSPWDFQLSAAWRYFGEVQLDSNSTQPLLAGGYNAVENRLPAYSWFDLAGDWTVRQGVDLRAGVDNIFDRDPPITAIQPLPEGNGNTYPGTYDSVGRYIFIAATIKY